MLVFQEVCGKSGFTVSVFEVPEMFLEPDSELPSGLSGVLHAAFTIYNFEVRHPRYV